MSTSTLVTKSIPANTGNYTKGRTKSISEITVHHMAGNLTVDQCGALWQIAGKSVSSHYGVQYGNIGQYVDEANTAWCNGNWDANCRAVTIEAANSCSATKGDDLGWPISDDTLETLINLVADIAKRNDLHPLVCGKTLTWHSMYKATACPGPYLMSKMQYICDEANKINEAAEQTGSGALYGVVKQVIALSDKSNAEAYAAKLNAQGESDAYYKVIEI